MSLLWRTLLLFLPMVIFSIINAALHRAYNEARLAREAARNPASAAPTSPSSPPLPPVPASPARPVSAFWFCLGAALMALYLYAMLRFTVEVMDEPILVHFPGGGGGGGSDEDEDEEDGGYQGELDPGPRIRAERRRERLNRHAGDRRY